MIYRCDGCFTLCDGHDWDEVRECPSCGHELYHEVEVSKPLYICSPCATATLAEVIATDAAILKALLAGWAPIYMPKILGKIDDNPILRELALQACEAVIPFCPAVLVIGDRRTEGMTRDLKCWNENHGPHVDYTRDLGGLLITAVDRELSR